MKDFGPFRNEVISRANVYSFSHVFKQTIVMIGANQIIRKDEEVRGRGGVG
jgi:hypothetical protein